MISTAIYTRISDDAEGARLGVVRQEEDCRELLEQRGWDLARVYEDNDISAFSGKTRPAYRQMLEDLRAGQLQAVIAWHPDRLHRQPKELEEFIEVVERAGAKVETVKAGHFDLGTPSGRAVARTLGAWARYESEHKAERQHRKHLELAANGKDAGGGRPFGYEDDRRTARPAEADLVREASKRVLEGESVRAVCRSWTERGIATVNGAKWSSQVLQRILTSARISGRREYGIGPDGKRVAIGRITNDHAEFDAIVSAEESDRLRELLGDPARRKNGFAREYLLTGGIARCSLCGQALVARPRADKRRSMVCASGPGFNGCGKIRVLAEPLEDLVVGALLEAIDGGALAKALKRTDDHTATAELLEVEAKLTQLAEAWSDGEISRVEWQAAAKRLQERQTGLQRRIEAQRRSAVLDNIPDALRAAWPALPLHRRRAILGALIEAVDVGPAVRGRNWFDGARVSIRWKV